MLSLAKFYLLIVLVDSVVAVRSVAKVPVNIDEENINENIA